ncbi:MAG TPA: flagellar filament capping protein FliD [Anaerolineales bacterium]|nr:flagellar filament capping protein FliD [Anaerolineales bacterium]
MTISSTGTLSSYFTSLISNIITVESQPLTRAQTARDQVNVRRNLFNQVNTKLTDLQSSVRALISTQASYAFESGRTSKVTAPSGSTVLTASAGSSAAVGRYAVSVTTLAAAHRVHGDAQTAANTALNYTGSFTLNGASIAIESNDTLIDIAAAINSATYADGEAVRASVVDKRLVLENEKGGEGNLIEAADVGGGILQGLGVLTSGGAFSHVLQTPSTASFTVNGIAITRDSNTGLTDVVNGLTLNLAADAQGKTAEIEVSADSTPEKTAVEGFITKFNALQTYLTQQSKVEVSGAAGSSTATYTRGALAGEQIFTELRSSLFSAFVGTSSNDGSLAALREIGVTIDDNLNASISDADKFQEALTSKRADVVKLLDSVMGKFETTLGRFTGTSGYMQQRFTSFDNEQTNLTQKISDLTLRINDRRTALTAQYSQMAVTLQLLQYDYELSLSLFV